MKSTPLTIVLREFVRAAREWRIWLFLGLLDVKNRFRRSAVGPLWIFLSLIVTSAGAGLVYGVLFDQPLTQFLPILTAGLVVWTFLVTTLTEGGYAFVGAEGYIKQFSQPMQIYLFRAFVNHAVVLGMGLLVVFLVLLSLQGPPVLNVILALPGLLILLLAGLAHVVLSAYVTTRFRDFPHAMGGFLQVLFFVTPVILPVDALREHKLALVYQLNPAHYLIDIVRHPLVTAEFASRDSYFFGGVYLCIVWLIALRIASYWGSRIVFLL